MNFSALFFAWALVAIETLAQTVPRAYFLQLRQDQQITSQDLVKKAADQPVALTVRYELEDFHSLSVLVEDEAHVDILKRMPEVESVVPVSRVAHPYSTSMAFSGFSTADSQSASKKRNLKSRGSDSGNSIASTKIPARDANNQTINFNAPPDMTGVTHLHHHNILGAGIKIAIIDTGIDYTHPSLGACFGPTCKVAFGHDFVGDAYGDTTFDPQPKPDPRPGCWAGFHGTHVAGIIGMDDSETFPGLRGVAPRATLGMYRVFGCSGFGSDDAVMAAMQRAVSDGADVVSLSLAETGTWDGYTPSLPLRAAVNALRDQGVAVIAAGG